MVGMYEAFKLGIVLALVLPGIGAGRQGPQAQTKPVQWLSIEAAEKLVNGAFKSGRPGVRMLGSAKLVEVEAPDVKGLIGGQLYRVVGGCEISTDSPESLLIVDRKPHALGTGFGGCGLTSFCVADLDKDGVPELYYTYSWGSGLHRALLCVVSKSWGFKTIGFGCFLHRDWVVRKTKDGGVDLYLGRIEPWSPDKPDTNLNYPVGIKLGTLSLKTVSGKPSPTVDFVPSLPKDVKGDLWLPKLAKPNR